MCIVRVEPDEAIRADAVRVPFADDGSVIVPPFTRTTTNAIAVAADTDEFGRGGRGLFEGVEWKIGSQGAEHRAASFPKANAELRTC
jgi:hypothetical protein